MATKGDFALSKKARLEIEAQLEARSRLLLLEIQKHVEPGSTFTISELQIKIPDLVTNLDAFRNLTSDGRIRRKEGSSAWSENQVFVLPK